MHDPADEDNQPAADQTGHGSPWERERHARSWWVDADERDTRSDTADQQAEDRDAAARARDDTADRLPRDARAREELAYQRIREVTRRLNALDAGEIHQHVHLQQAGEAIQEAIDSGADEPLLHLLREVSKLLDVRFADVIAVGIQRSSLRVDLQHADQHLAGAAGDRSAAAADRAAAASDRAAAAAPRRGPSAGPPRPTEPPMNQGRRSTDRSGSPLPKPVDAAAERPRTGDPGVGLPHRPRGTAAGVSCSAAAGTTPATVDSRR